MRKFLGSLVDRLCDRVAARAITRIEQRRLHPKRLLLESAQRDSAGYATERMHDALILDTREELLKLALARMPETGSILEFGVASGHSMRFLAGLTSRPIHGFDSFQGLPEDWPGRNEELGHYSMGGTPPPVPGHVTLHAGLFDQTLPAFLAANDEAAAFIHVDCDLYSSTKTVLEHLRPRIVAGTVIAFDEYFNHVNWRQNEFKAFQEFVAAHNVVYRYLAWSYQQAAVVIEDIAAG